MKQVQASSGLRERRAMTADLVSDANLARLRAAAPAALQVTVAGVEVWLLARPAMFIPSRDAVLVADMHWGKASAFRAASIPVPNGTTASDLARLSEVLRLTNA